MSIQPIRFFGDPVLTTPALEVVDFDKVDSVLVNNIEKEKIVSYSYNYIHVIIKICYDVTSKSPSIQKIAHVMYMFSE